MKNSSKRAFFLTGAILLSFTQTSSLHRALAAPIQTSPDDSEFQCQCTCGPSEMPGTEVRFSPPDGDPNKCDSYDGMECEVANGDDSDERTVLGLCKGVLRQTGENFEFPADTYEDLGMPGDYSAGVQRTVKFECGDHFETYVSIRTEDSAAKSVRCVWFFKNSGRSMPRHDGFLWYAEGVESNDRYYREFGRYTAGRARIDFLQEFPNGPGLTPSLNAGNFNVRYIGVDAAGIPAEIRFGTPITDVWKRVTGNDSVLFERRLRPPRECGPNMLRFTVYALRDKELRMPTGMRCMSIDYMSWYGLGRVGDKGYLHIATTSDSSSRWISVGDAGLPIVAVDVCDRADSCNVANVRLRRMCINVDKYKGPILTVPEWSEVWVPDAESRATSKQKFPDSNCPFTDNSDWDY